jgi:hypothetical protein
MMDETEEKPTTVAGNFQINCHLTDKRQLVVTGYIYFSDSPEQIHKRIDAAQDAVDRQVIRLDVVSKEAELAQGDAQLDSFAEHYKTILKRQQSGRKLTSQEKQMVEKYDESVSFVLRRKDSLRAAIEEARRKLNGAAT